MIYGEILKFFTFYHFDFDPRFPPFLLYVRWKSGVTFVGRCFRDVSSFFKIGGLRECFPQIRACFYYKYTGHLVEHVTVW